MENRGETIPQGVVSLVPRLYPQEVARAEKQTHLIQMTQILVPTLVTLVKSLSLAKPVSFTINLRE